MRRVLFFILLCLPILIKAQTPTRFLGDKESPISLSRIDMEYRKKITTLPPFDVHKLIEEDKLFDNTEVENRPISSDDWNLIIRNIATGIVVCNEHVTHGSAIVRTSGWPPGIYLVQGTKDGKTLTKKISVNRK